MSEEICDIVITDAPRSLKADFKAVCAIERMTYRDMLRELVDFYVKHNEAYKRKTQLLRDFQVHHL